MRYLLGIIFIIAIAVSAVDVLRNDITPSITQSHQPAISSDKPSANEAHQGNHVKEAQDRDANLAKVHTQVEKLRTLTALNEILPIKRDLEALLKVYPSAALGVKNSILDPTTTPRAQLALIHSLAASGGTEAEVVLTDFATSLSYPDAVRLQAITTISELTNPSRATTEVLWRIYDMDALTNQQISESALLNLGILASNLNTTKSTEGLLIVQRMRSLAEDALLQNSSALPILIEALANSGSPEIVPLSDQLLSAEDPSTRALGVSALRLVKGEEVEMKILDVAEADDSVETRKAALEALNVRSPTQRVVTTLTRLVLTEEDSKARREIIKYLGERGRGFTGSSEALRELIAAESDPENYSLAVQMLS